MFSEIRFQKATSKRISVDIYETSLNYLINGYRETTCMGFWKFKFLHFLRCLTMSAEVMKSKFVCRPSVYGIDCMWTCCLDFFQILVVVCFEENKRTHFPILTLKIAAGNFQTFPEFSFRWSSQNYMGYLWPYRLFEIMWCTCDFFRKYDFLQRCMLLIQLWFFLLF